MKLKSHVSITFKPYTRDYNPLPELVLLFIILIPILVPFFLNPNSCLHGTHIQLLLPPCPLYFFAGIPCLFCGATTSLTYLTQGQVLKAFQANPSAPLLYILFIVSAILLMKAILGRKSLSVSISFSLKDLIFIFAFLWGLKLMVWFYSTSSLSIR